MPSPSFLKRPEALTEDLSLPFTLYLVSSPFNPNLSKMLKCKHSKNHSFCQSPIPKNPFILLIILISSNLLH